MKPNSLSEEDLRYLHKEGALDSKDLRNLYREKPDFATFSQVGSRWSLGIGLAFFLAGIIFFFAWNWSEMDKWAKFGLLGIGILCFFLSSLGFKSRFPMLADMLGLGANVLVGVFLAVYGQIYQTGADPWNLFFGWAMLITPWVIGSRFQVNWILWASLLNLSIWLAQMDGLIPWGILAGKETYIFLALSVIPFFLIELRRLILYRNEEGMSWLKPMYGHVLLQSAVVTLLTSAFMITVIEVGRRGWGNVPSLLVYGIYLGWLYWFSWRKRGLSTDLVMGTLSFCISAITVWGRIIFEIGKGEGAFLLMFFAVFGVFSLTGVWLRSELKRPRPQIIEGANP